MINELFFMNGYEVYVLSAFSFTLLSFSALYLITKVQFIKEQRKTEGKEIYSDELAGQIMTANSTYVVRFGVRLRGTIYTFTGYRSVHSDHIEPVKGGI